MDTVVDTIFVVASKSSISVHETMLFCIIIIFAVFAGFGMGKYEWKGK